MSDNKVVTLGGKPHELPSGLEIPGARELVNSLDVAVKEGADQILIAYRDKDGYYRSSWQGSHMTLMAMTTRASYALNVDWDEQQKKV